MKRIGIFGSTGHIGKELVKLDGFVPLVADITKSDEVRLAINSFDVDVVVNLACISDVNFCEQKENREKVIKVNSTGAYNINLAAEEMNIPVVLLSTDHVFSGAYHNQGKPGPYGEKAIPNPVNVYGLSKFSAEAMADAFDNAKVVRTSRVFDDWILSELHIEKSYPTFIHRSFLYIQHFISVFHDYLINLDMMPKILHISGSETTSWFNFMKRASEIFDTESSFVMKRSGEHPDETVPRPFYAGLKTDVSRKLGLKQYSWLDGLKKLHSDISIRELGYG